MKFLFDLFPIILFFAAYELGESFPVAANAILAGLGIQLETATKPGVFLATLVAILATFMQLAWAWFRYRRIDTMLWVSLALIVGFGGLTLFLHDETFIKWKPTVLYWIFALALGLAPLLFERNLIRLMMEKQLSLPDVVWTRLNLGWAGFFAFMGVANLYVALNYSTDAWVNFKMFGSLGLMLVFIIGQTLYLSRHLDAMPTQEAREEKE
ncbi:MAG TPA: septation protein A [Thiobacillaceae bacterium]|nr:septation protein A [Thiobacillaceae bacterium]HNU63000.1 septation protein A [Thiobacillaceae bacterium]